MTLKACATVVGLMSLANFCVIVTNVAHASDNLTHILFESLSFWLYSLLIELTCTAH